jgi:hypothetical protein
MPGASQCREVVPTGGSSLASGTQHAVRAQHRSRHSSMTLVLRRISSRGMPAQHLARLRACRSSGITVVRAGRSVPAWFDTLAWDVRRPHKSWRPDGGVLQDRIAGQQHLSLSEDGRPIGAGRCRTARSCRAAGAAKLASETRTRDQRRPRTTDPAPGPEP